MRPPDLSSFAGRRVLITGAASGIGRALALALAADGAALYLTDIADAGLASVTDKLASAGQPPRLTAAFDIADIDAVSGFASEVHADGGALDVVMNVAGISVWGTVDDLEHRHWRSMIEVNLMGPIHVIESFVPAMVHAGRGGWLVNVSSAAGLIGLPWHAAYSASKFGVRGISEVLRFDLREHGIGVSLVCPGAVSSPLTETVELAGIDAQHPAFRRVHARFVERAVTPEQAAAAIVRGVGRGRYLIYTSRDIQAVHLVQRVAPPAYALAMRTLNTAASRIRRRAAAGQRQ
jgi:NAD(P)-dependent dehydrogenase (short-subunit alcohol dehydrogenase family)